MMRVVAVLMLSCGLLTAGCARTIEDNYPSLARRDAERMVGSIDSPPPAVAPPPLPPATGSTLERIAGLRRAALSAHQRFLARRGEASGMVGRASGAAVASEAWSVAQVALADLDSSRSNAMIALADLDALYIRAAEAAVPSGGSGDLTAVAEARDEVTGWIAQEDGILAGLRGRLRS